MSVLEKLSDEEAKAYITEVARDAEVVDLTQDPAREERDPNAGMYADLIPSGNVGDVNSTARGTGARFNAGKPKLEYIPCGALASLVRCRDDYKYREDHRLLMLALADFESRRAEDGLARAFQHIPTESRIAATCAVFDYGAMKYAPFNWAKGMAWSVPLACAKRHWIAITRGEEIDAESGLPHWGHIGCNLVMLAHYRRFYKEGDDRPPAWAFGGEK